MDRGASSQEESLGSQRVGHKGAANIGQQQGLKEETLDQESSDRLTDLNLQG